MLYVCVVALDLEPQILVPHLCVCVFTTTAFVNMRTSAGFLELEQNNAYSQNGIIASFDHATAEKLYSYRVRLSVCTRECMRVCAVSTIIRIISGLLDPPNGFYIPHNIILLFAQAGHVTYDSLCVCLLLFYVPYIESRIVSLVCVPPLTSPDLRGLLL